MNGPARLTAWANPFSVRSFRSQLRCTSAKASGVLTAVCSFVKVAHDLHGRLIVDWPIVAEAILIVLASRLCSAICASQGGYFNKASNHPLRYAPLLPSNWASVQHTSVITPNEIKLAGSMSLRLKLPWGFAR